MDETERRRRRQLEQLVAMANGDLQATEGEREAARSRALKIAEELGIGNPFVEYAEARERETTGTSNWTGDAWKPGEDRDNWARRMSDDTHHNGEHVNAFVREDSHTIDDLVTGFGSLFGDGKIDDTDDFLGRAKDRLFRD